MILTARKIMIFGSALALAGGLTGGYVSLTGGHADSRHSAAPPRTSASAQHVDYDNDVNGQHNGGAKDMVMVAGGKTVQINKVGIKVHNAGLFSAKVCPTNTLGDDCFNIGAGTTNYGAAELPVGEDVTIHGSAIGGKSAPDLHVSLDDSRNDYQMHCFRFDGTTLNLSFTEKPCDDPKF